MKLTPTIIAEIIAVSVQEAVEAHYDNIMAGKKSSLFVTSDLGYGVRYNIHSSGRINKEQLIMSCTCNGVVVFKIEYNAEYTEHVNPAIDALSNVVWAVIKKEQDKESKDV